MSASISPQQSSHQQMRTQAKSNRVLACVLCQQRKIRCDRTFPCSNCTKQNARCVPATQTRPRRKRFPERELLDRLRRYEALLRENKVKFEPMHKEEHSSGEQDDGEDNEESAADGQVRSSASPSVSLKSENVTEARSIWHAMSHEAPSNTDKDTPIANALESSIKGVWESLDSDSILLGMNRSPVDLSTFHPDPVSAFKMWQLYLDNVDPLLKVTHAPTLQARFVAAVSNVSAITPALEALIFAIYTLAVTSIQPDPCQDMFGMSREDLLTKYQFGCQQALMNAGYLRTSDRECITALMMYLMSMRHPTNPRAVITMLGVAVRLAQCLGIHRESSLAKCSVFEAEMRRRLWWALMLYDTRIGEKADYKDTTLAPTWDCRLPINCNDSDLWPDMKEPPPPSRGRPTASLFVVARAELADHMRNSSYYLDFCNPSLKPLARELPDNGSVDALEQKMVREYLTGCDDDNANQFFAKTMISFYILRARLFEHFTQFLKTNGQQSESERDRGMEIALDFLDCDTILLSSPLCQGFLWYLQSYFPFPAYMHVIQDLRRRPLSRVAGRAWSVMHVNYQSRFKAYFHPVRDQAKLISPISILFGRTILTAWEALQKSVEDPNTLSTPGLVTEILARHLAAMPISTNCDAVSLLNTSGLEPCPPVPALSHGQLNMAAMGMNGVQDPFGISADAMPYPSMVAADSFTYDTNQLDWYMQS